MWLTDAMVVKCTKEIMDLRPEWNENLVLAVKGL